MFHHVQNEHGRDVSRKGFTGFMNDGFETREEDAYGDGLQSIQANHFNGLKLEYDSKQNKGILSFLRELDDKHECFLFWH